MPSVEGLSQPVCLLLFLQISTIMYPQVVVLSLLLLLIGAVASYARVVRGVAGQPVTLPCSYSVANSAVTSMCWGRGTCPSSQCSNELIRTDGLSVTFRKNVRYQLKGNLLQGNVSLTIENAVKSDSGQYCCRIEHPGWFNDAKITLSLEIQPARTTRVPMTPRVTTSTSPMPTRMQIPKPARTTRVPMTPRVTTSTSPMPTCTQNPKPVATPPSTTQPEETQTMTPQETSAPSACSPLYSCPTDGNSTMTQSSDGLWHNNETQVFPAQSPGKSNQGFYIGIVLSTLLLLTFLIASATKKYLYFRKKMQPLSMVSLTDPHIGALQRAADVRGRAEDNVYIIEDNLYVMN